MTAYFQLVQKHYLLTQPMTNFWAFETFFTGLLLFSFQGKNNPGTNN